MQLRNAVALTGVLIVVLCVTALALGAEFADSCSFMYHPGNVDVVCVFHAPPCWDFESAAVWYCNPIQACGTVDAQVWVNGQFVDQTGWVAPGGVSPYFDVTSIVADGDSAVVALHHPVCQVGHGCCSTGTVETWGGTIHISGDVKATTASIEQPGRLGETWGLIKALWRE